MTCDHEFDDLTSNNALLSTIGRNFNTMASLATGWKKLTGHV